MTQIVNNFEISDTTMKDFKKEKRTENLCSIFMTENIHGNILYFVRKMFTVCSLLRQPKFQVLKMQTVQTIG